MASQPEPSVTSPELQTTQAAPKESSLELRLGTYWLVRVGIVMLLTGLVWAGYYAYDRFGLGPVGKLSLLYLASGALLGLGGWLQRGKEQLAVRNFGQVVFAGGLAAVYFTTYAAHHSDVLRIIDSPLVSALALLVWAGFMVWVADRKKSEALALFALCLAYYTGVVAHIGLFTLYSNLVLTLVGVLLLLRNRWISLSFGCLIGTYAGFVFWRFYDAGWSWDLNPEAVYKGNVVLGCYWALFTTAAFLGKGEKLGQRASAAFVSLNNAAFFFLVLLSMIKLSTGSLWKFCLVYGAELVVLSVAAVRYLPTARLVRHAYLTQGVVLMTTGLVIKYSGFTLALMLGAESVILLVVGGFLQNRILIYASPIAASLALGFTMANLEEGGRTGLLTNLAVLAAMIFNVVWARWRELEIVNKRWQPLAAFMALLALVEWVATVLEHVPAYWEALTLAASGVLVLTVGCWRRNYESALASAVLLALGLLVFAIEPNAARSVTWPNLLAILTPLLIQQKLRREPEWLPVKSGWHHAFIVMAGLCLWLFVSRLIIEQSGGAHFYLTAGWAGVALGMFAAGLLLRERLYRWLGLGILACAVGRVVFSDVWKLATVYRILSFLALGAVLLVLGFLYNKYQDKIKQWL